MGAEVVPPPLSLFLGDGDEVRKSNLIKQRCRGLEKGEGHLMLSGSLNLLNKAEGVVDVLFIAHKGIGHILSRHQPPILIFVESHVIDQQTVMVRNENYWGARPHLDKVVFKVIQDANQRLNALITGEIDLALSLSTDSLQQVMDDPNLDLVSLNKVQMNMIAFSYENGPVANPLVRQALVMATDRQALVDAAFSEGTAKVTKVPLPGNSWAYDDSLQGLVPDYDPEGAKKLLEEAGYPDGFEITLSYAASVERDRVGIVLQQMWKNDLKPAPAARDTAWCAPPGP